MKIFFNPSVTLKLYIKKESTELELYKIKLFRVVTLNFYQCVTYYLFAKFVITASSNFYTT